MEKDHALLGREPPSRRFVEILSPGRASFWRAYGPIAALLAAHFLVACAVVDIPGEQLTFEASGIVSNFRPAFVTVLVFTPFVGFVWLVATNTEERPSSRIARWFLTTPWAEIALWRIVPMLVLFSALQIIFLPIKKNIPELVPFQWDPIFMEIDRSLFFGNDPWVVTHSLFRDAIATKIIDFFYGAWLPVMLIVYLAAAAMPLTSAPRMTFFVAFFLNWAIAGTLLAIVFSSAGPVFVEPLFNDQTFIPLKEHLARQDSKWEIFALNLQEILWNGYTRPRYPFYGISAFPSMHVCIAVTMTLFGFALNRWLGWFLALFTGVILIGSVHLGWHYAIDGIGGTVLALAIWKPSRQFAEWWLGQAVASRDLAHAAETHISGARRQS